MWLHIPSMASSYSAVSACSAKDCEPGSTTWASRIAPSVTLSGKLTQPPSWSRAWKKARWMRHLSGPTLPPSTADAGVERWIASLPDSIARTCPSPADVQASTGRAPVSSSRSSASPTIAMRGSSFWRTSEASLLPPPPLWTRKRANSKSERSPASWENWPTAGGMRNGSLFQRPTWAPVMAVSGGSVSRGEAWATPDCNESTYSNGLMGPNIRQQANQWMTPCVPNGGRAVSAEVVANKGSTENGKKTVGLESQVRHVWPTPNVLAASNDLSLKCSGDGRIKPNKLGWAVAESEKNWATPRATDGDKGGPNQRGGRGDPILPGQVCNWPTPTARMHNGGGNATIRPDGKSRMDMLDWKAESFSLPAHPISDGQKSSPTALSSPPQSPLVASVSGGTTRPDLSERKRLNPAFAAWLMGWPWWWTNPETLNFGASETASWRLRLHALLSSYFGGPDSMESDLTQQVAVALSVAQGGAA